MAGAAAGAAFRTEPRSTGSGCADALAAGLVARVDEIDALLASTAVGEVEVSALGEDALSSLVLRLERVQCRLDAARARVTGELDAREATVDEFGLRTGGWIASKTHTPVKPAKRRAQVSRRLRDEFPLLLEALANGAVSWWHADLFCRAANPRIADLLGLLLPELIELAQDLPYSGWCSELRRIASRIDLDGGHDPDDDVEANRLHLHRTFDGTHELRGRLVGALGASFAEMLERETDRQYRHYRGLADATNDESTIPPRPTLRALALVELCRKGIASDPATTNAPVTDLTLTHHLEPINDFGHAHDVGHDHHHDCGQGCGAGGARGRVSVNATGRCARDGCNREFTTAAGQVLTDRELGCRVCDPVISLLRLDGNGLPLDLQRSQRYATADQCRAIAARDRHCRFPGCDQPIRWCDRHHIVRFSDGGSSDLANYVALCRFHHGITHRRGWHLTAEPDGGLVWTTPAGRRLHSPLPTRARAGPVRVE